LYDQELRRYLLLRKEAKNRPVKVEIAPSGAKVVMSQTGPNINAGVFNEESGEFEDFGHFGQQKTPSMSSNGFSEMSYMTEGSKKRKTSNTVPSEHLPSTIRDPNERRKRRAAIRPSIPEEIEQRKHEFKEYMMANMAQFPIDAQGHIIGYNGKPIKYSNLDKSIDRLINPRMENMPSPKGTQLLSNKAMKDPYLKNLILARFNTRIPRTDDNIFDSFTPSPMYSNINEQSKLLEPITTPFNKRRTFVNKRLQPINSQKGTGRNSFKPSLWR